MGGGYRSNGPTRIIVAVAALSLVLAGCAGFGPPQSCGAGGTADEVAFARAFTALELVDGTTGQPPAERDPEFGPIFTTAAQLAIRAEALAGVSVRACVEGRTGGAKIGFDGTQTLSAGVGTMPLGSFEAGPWVVRVIVDGVLVKNLPFMTR